MIKSKIKQRHYKGFAEQNLITKSFKKYTTQEYGKEFCVKRALFMRAILFTVIYNFLIYLHGFDRDINLW